ncbi:hypothetical protein [Sinorhizobium americanum]|uniref:hypothetical protein n=1 Tax=Sinorhizobium americanum TaxID=194963 RepID=UPI0009EF6216|nr:hypothetical protein [Sinorhizobium americanum]
MGRIFIVHRLILAVLAALFATIPAVAAPLCGELAFAGLLAKCNRGEPIEITLSSGKPLGKGAVALQSGAYYEMRITADGSAELALTGAPFFRAIWMNEIVVNGVEVRPMAIDSLEFDEAGTATLSFVAIKPGSYEIKIPDTKSDSQKVQISIE